MTLWTDGRYFLQDEELGKECFFEAEWEFGGSDNGGVA